MDLCDMYTVPEVGGIAHHQSQGEGEAANPHRPVPQGFEPWTSEFVVQHSTPEPPALRPLQGDQSGELIRLGQ